jgi:demethylmenaquinone methyltransferase/2-methoxy-6-polyprenyl-1,4-benzoquinol methylase
MPSSYYVPGEKRAERVQDLFGTIASRYDLINDLQSFGLHRLWKNKLVKLAAPQSSDSALDVCCGTGDIALRFAPLVREVTGFDFSEPMLQVARNRAARIPAAAAVKFIQGDALRLPFSDCQFDIVTIGYGLRNLSDFNRGLEELWRVLKPGGRLLILDFGKPENRCWRWAYFQYLRWLVPLFGRIFCGNSATHAYILESLLNYPAQKGVAARLEQFGSPDSQTWNLLGGVMSINRAIKPA